MLPFFKDLKKSIIFTGCVCLILGVILLVYPRTTSAVICYTIGGVVLLRGIFGILRYFSNKEPSFWGKFDLFIGLLLSGIGLFMIIRVDLIASVIPYVLGIFITLDGFANLQKAFNIKRAGHPRWWLIGLVALISVGLGIAMLINPFRAAMTMISFIGISLIYNGLMNFATVFYMSRAQKEADRSSD